MPWPKEAASSEGPGSDGASWISDVGSDSDTPGKPPHKTRIRFTPKATGESLTPIGTGGKRKAYQFLEESTKKFKNSPSLFSAKPKSNVIGDSKKDGFHVDNQGRTSEQHQNIQLRANIQKSKHGAGGKKTATVAHVEIGGRTETGAAWRGTVVQKALGHSARLSAKVDAKGADSRSPSPVKTSKNRNSKSGLPKSQPKVQA